MVKRSFSKLRVALKIAVNPSLSILQCVSETAPRPKVVGLNKPVEREYKTGVITSSFYNKNNDYVRS